MVHFSRIGIFCQCAPIYVLAAQILFRVPRCEFSALIETVVEETVKCYVFPLQSLVSWGNTSCFGIFFRSVWLKEVHVKKQTPNPPPPKKKTNPKTNNPEYLPPPKKTHPKLRGCVCITPHLIAVGVMSKIFSAWFSLS